MEKHNVAYAEGDGIGPEIMTAVQRILEAAGTSHWIHWCPVTIGQKAYEAGCHSGVTPEGWETIRKAGVLLKAPLTTPQGGGYKSVNVTLRKSLGLYANVRPCMAYAPFVKTRHPALNLVIIRENEEDLYAGIEHQQTNDVVQCLKLISRTGCEKIIRHAFDYAIQHNRKKVTCMTKDNIMKLTDGLFHKVFDEITAEIILENPQIFTEHLIIDIGAARLADTPEQFDVIVTTNLYGDILSDIAAQIAGSVGLAGSANIGEQCAVFEAIHGSAPDIAGQDIANPSGLLQAAVQMLIHLDLPKAATLIQNAWLKTLEDGVHTRDIYNKETSQSCVGTQGFADAVIARLGQTPDRLPCVSYVTPASPHKTPKNTGKTPRIHAPAVKTLVGVDVFVDWQGGSPNNLANSLNTQNATNTMNTTPLRLAMITNRGIKVWPNGLSETFCTDHWRCRFLAPEGETMGHGDVLDLLSCFNKAGLDFIKTEHLYNFDTVPGYTMGQGQ
jgi:isocitrate dehydrogenase